MYGCYEASVVYGFCENNRYKEISEKWLYEFNEGLSKGETEITVYAMDVIRNHRGGTLYGIGVTLNPETGKAEASDKEKEVVQKMYNMMADKSMYSDIGYYIGLYGDIEREHDEYDPEKKKKREREKE